MAPKSVFAPSTPSMATKQWKEVPGAEIQASVEKMEGPVTLRIWADDADFVEKMVLEELKLHDVQKTLPIRIIKQAPPEILEVLPDEVPTDRAIRHRIRLITRTLPNTEENEGILIEMPNYQEMKNGKIDPKNAVRWGLAQTGRLSQFFVPKDLRPHDYKERVRKSIHDLFRQMGLRLNPIYQGFKKTSLPQKLDIVGIWVMNITKQKKLPILVLAPAGESSFQVCLPTPNGPKWYSYRKAQLFLSKQPFILNSDDSILFLKDALIGRFSSSPTLCLIESSNIQPIFKIRHPYDHENGELRLCSHLGIDGLPIRIGWIRRSDKDPNVPAVCPTQVCSKFQGLFMNEREISNIFYSVQERPVSAKRVTGTRQRDKETKISWNPHTMEITMLNLQNDDIPKEWAFLIHRLREESTFLDMATRLPEPLHSISRLEDDKYFFYDGD